MFYTHHSFSLPHYIGPVADQFCFRTYISFLFKDCAFEEVRGWQTTKEYKQVGTTPRTQTNGHDTRGAQASGHNTEDTNKRARYQRHGTTGPQYQVARTKGNSSKDENTAAQYQGALTKGHNAKGQK